MNFKKILLLSLALLLPVAVFLFLKGFGKNEFAVEPLFQHSVDKPSNCEFEVRAPYVVNDSILNKLKWSESDSLTLLIFDQATDRRMASQVSRLRTELRDGVNFIAINEHEPVIDCAFLRTPSHNAVLIDSKKRIRGQYDLTDLDEGDRLIMEVKIILKKY